MLHAGAALARSMVVPLLLPILLLLLLLLLLPRLPAPVHAIVRRLFDVLAQERHRQAKLATVPLPVRPAAARAAARRQWSAP